MAKVTQKYNVTVCYNTPAKLDKLARGYAVLIKIALRILEQEKKITPTTCQFNNTNSRHANEKRKLNFIENK